MNQIDLNADIGEGFDFDNEIIPLVTSVNIACGFHAGGPLLMNKTVELAIKQQVKIGAHPSFPDKENFGRSRMVRSFEEIYTDTLYQIGALDALVIAQGGTLHHVKPHGMLYNQAANEPEVANAIISAIYDYNPNLLLFVLAGSHFVELARQKGLKVKEEVFADRRYNDDGSLVDRREAHAVLSNRQDVIEQVLRFIQAQEVKTISGKIIPIKADTICMHGDNEHAVELLKAIHQVLT